MSDAGTTFDLPGPEGRSISASARVAVVQGQAPAVIELPKGADVSLGRSRSSSLVIDDRAASRLHVTLRWDGGATVLLTDHGSRNGTRVDGSRVDGTARLASGSEIAVGSVVLVISVPPGASAANPKPSAIDDRDLAAFDPVMLQVIEIADRAARGEVTVLIEGETGVGKELVARRIHSKSRRARAPFVAVNCGSIPDSLAESTLFGHERGSFTGASEDRIGLFEAAHGGTLFLDEVGELSARVQARLLRVLEERAVTRVGSTETLPVDVRLVAATNRDLTSMAREGRFREDLLYRLDVLRIAIPPLRSRPDDLLPLARRFLAEHSGGREQELGDDAVAALRAHAWPGNVRELQNAIARAVTVATGETIGAGDLFGADKPGRGGALRSQVHEVERDAIVEALELCGGNQTRASERLGISRRALIYKMERLGLKRPPSGS